MNVRSGTCPNCQNDLTSAIASGAAACPGCGAAINNPAPPLIPVPPALTVARAIGRSSPPWYVIVLIILVGILGFAIVGLALLYAGCVFIMNKFNH